MCGSSYRQDRQAKTVKKGQGRRQVEARRLISTAFMYLLTHEGAA
jgi:hypothetical protein